MHQIVNQLQQVQQHISQVSQEFQTIHNQLSSVTSQVQQLNQQQRQFGTSVGSTYGQPYTNATYGQSYTQPYAQSQPQYGQHISTPSYGQQQYGGQMSSQFGSNQASSVARVMNAAPPVSNSFENRYSPSSQVSSSIHTPALQSVMNADSQSRLQSARTGRQSEYSSYGRTF